MKARSATEHEFRHGHASPLNCAKGHILCYGMLRYTMLGALLVRHYVASLQFFIYRRAQ